MKKSLFCLFSAIVLYGDIYGKYEDCTFNVFLNSNTSQWMCNCSLNDTNITDLNSTFGSDISFNTSNGYLTFNGGEWENIKIISNSRTHINYNKEISCDSFNITGSFINAGGLYALNSVNCSSNILFNHGNIFVGSGNIEAGRKEQYALPTSEFSVENYVIDENCFVKNLTNSGKILSNSILVRNMYFVMPHDGKTSPYIKTDVLKLENTRLNVSEGKIRTKVLDSDDLSSIDCNTECGDDFIDIYMRHAKNNNIKTVYNSNIMIDDISDEFDIEFKNQQIKGRKIKAKKTIDYLAKIGITNYSKYSDEQLRQHWNEIINKNKILDYEDRPIEGDRLDVCKELLINWFNASLTTDNARNTMVLFLMCNEYSKKHNKDNTNGVCFCFIRDITGGAYSNYPDIILNDYVSQLYIFGLDCDKQDLAKIAFQSEYVLVHELRHAIHNILGTFEIEELNLESLNKLVAPCFDNLLIQQLFCPFLGDLQTICKTVIKSEHIDFSEQLLQNAVNLSLFVIEYIIFSGNEEMHNMYGIYYDYERGQIICDDLNDINLTLEYNKMIRWMHISSFKYRTNINDDIKNFFEKRFLALKNTPNIPKGIVDIINKVIAYNKPGIKNPFNDIQAYIPNQEAIKTLCEIIKKE